MALLNHKWLMSAPAAVASPFRWPSMLSAAQVTAIDQSAAALMLPERMPTRINVRTDHFCRRGFARAATTIRRVGI